MNFFKQDFIQFSMGNPVAFNVTLNGSHTGQPGVTAIVAKGPTSAWCLLADHPQNPGAPVTNGVQEYAEAVARVAETTVDAFSWYELDSEGRFDEVPLQGGCFGFAPLLEEGHSPRSYEALLACLLRKHGPVPEGAQVAILQCLERFKDEKKPPK